MTFVATSHRPMLLPVPLPWLWLWLLLPLMISANIDLTSRQYKTMLHADLFNTPNNDPKKRQDHVKRVLKQLEQVLTATATKAGATGTSGKFALKDDTPRLVRYWDTAGDCQLHENHFTVRMRRSLEDYADDPWESMLKARSGDRYYSAYRSQFVRDCKKGYQDDKSKFDEDIARFDWTASLFSFSQKCWVELEDDKQMSLQLIGDVWGTMDTYMTKELDMDLSTPLTPVSNLTITEIAYEDFWINLEAGGGSDQMAQGKVTLWYHTEPHVDMNKPHKFTGVGNPIVAELSFRIKSKHEAWTDKTLVTMHTFWEQSATSLQQSKWLDPNSITKTAWIYQYDPAFCGHPHQQSSEARERHEA